MFLGRAAGFALAAVLAGGAIAQTVPDGQVPETGGLDIPANLQIFGKVDPNVRKATAIVNGAVITGTDVDQRVSLIAVANGATLTAEERERLKVQVLRQLIDETLQIQEARTNDITVTPEEITRSFAGVAQRLGQPANGLAAYLRKAGTSDRSLRRQIEGELAWTRYLRRRVEPFVNVGDEEVNAILERVKASQGTEEFALKEIYTEEGADAQASLASARAIMAEVQKGQQPFEYYARQFSVASTRGVGGDLGWVRAAQLPDALAATAQGMQIGQVAGPIQIPGGYSILYLTDKRRIGSADPRDSRLSLKQLTVRFPPNTSQTDAAARAAAFGKALQTVRGCGTVARIAATVNAEVVDNDTIRIRDLPPQLQEIMLKLQVGEASPPFGSATEGVRGLVLCGIDAPQGAAIPRADQVQGQLEQQRVNLRAQQKLRDLRRDAIVEYR
jgi:peptidyl-prolyl cis-trans isomerase SurA